jgi:2-oxoisovalerate dehydrogenase E1 component
MVFHLPRGIRFTLPVLRGKIKMVNLTKSDLEPSVILADYRLAVRSREVSLACRREVHSGRANFGASGDGKELAQLALARVFEPGDWRSGYYRDQTLMMALGNLTVRSFFAQLYAHADVKLEPTAAGRMMVTHFGSRVLNADGSWQDQTQLYNSAPDSSPTASQMPRLVGLAYASRLYRELEVLKEMPSFSRHGDEVAFGIIGNASAAEGMFWESINAIGVLKSPAVISIWDDGYGISVPNALQILKEDLSQLLSGFQRTDNGDGFDLYTVPGWNYPALIDTYRTAAGHARRFHVPSIIHITEMTQPLGHSTSGSHERYKSPERLAWESEYDPIARMRTWMLEDQITTEAALAKIEQEEQVDVRQERQAAWDAFVASLAGDLETVDGMLGEIEQETTCDLHEVRKRMGANVFPRRRDLFEAIQQTLLITRDQTGRTREQLIAWRNRKQQAYQSLYGTHLLSESGESPIHVTLCPPKYDIHVEEIPGHELLNCYFDHLFKRDPRVLTFGEDVGLLGGVNKTMSDLQAKYGPLRISDTGVRETTILGQAIGLAMRGLRPIAEIQYLDFLLYALQTMSDDLATIRWRTSGGHKAPVIVRTRGHRLEGMWHAGSLMAGIIHLVRGMHVLVPRDMTRAAGFYNTLLKGDDPGLVVEVLNGYRLKERMPTNLDEITVPLGVPEVLRSGDDITLVTYGALCRIVLDAVEALSETGIDTEVIDVQSLLPFDRQALIVDSLKKTNRLLIIDEDVPGGTSAYIMQQVLEKQGGYQWLDSGPRTLTAQAHRPAFGADGDYFSKPNKEDIFKAVYGIMHESQPTKYPLFYDE